MLTYADVCEFAKGVRRAAAALGEFALGLAERAWGSSPVESAPPPLAGEFAPSRAGESATPARGGEGVQLLAGEASSRGERETLRRWTPPPLAGGANSRELAAGEREEREALLAFTLSVVELLFYHCRWSCGGGHVEGEKKKTKKLQAASEAVEEEEEEEAAAAARSLVERLSAAANTIGTQFTCFTSAL